MVSGGDGDASEGQESLCHVDFVVELASGIDEILRDRGVVLEFGAQDLEFEFEFVLIERVFERSDDIFGFDEAFLSRDGVAF